MNNAIINLPRPVNEHVKNYLKNSSERILLQKELSRQMNTAIKIPLIIGGKRIFTSKTKTIICPHDHQKILGTYCEAGPVEIELAINEALKAQAVWHAMDWEQRAAVFLKAADLISNKYSAILNAATMLNQSKNMFQAEIDSTCEVADFFRFNAHFMQQIYKSQPISSPGVWNRVEYRPLDGFVVAISPFNFTAIAANLASAPALMGNVVLWKPASTSILSNYYLMELYEEAGIPPGVINFIPCSGSSLANTALIHPELAGVHFTGSTNTFNSIWRNVADHLSIYKNYPKLVGETGGKDYIFAHESCDIDSLAIALIKGSFEYQGQKCSACSRAYIPQKIWGSVKEKLLKELSGLKMGDVSDHNNFINAVIDEKSYYNTLNYIDKAKTSDEAEILFGGNGNMEKGYFIEPTVIVTTNPHFVTMREEIFAPVLTIYIYSDEEYENTLDLVDKTSPYALTGAIFAKDRAVICDLTNKLSFTAGNFYINDKPTGAVVGQQPFGGGRASGTNDKAGSHLNLLRWVNTRTIKETFAPQHHWKYDYMD